MAERSGIESDRVREFVLVPVHKYKKLVNAEGEDNQSKQEKELLEKQQQQQPHQHDSETAQPPEQEKQKSPSSAEGAVGDDPDGYTDPSDPSHSPDSSGINSRDAPARVNLERVPDPSGRAEKVTERAPTARVGTTDAAPATITTTTTNTPASDAGTSGQNGSPTPQHGPYDRGATGSSKTSVKRKGATLADRRKRMRELWLTL